MMKTELTIREGNLFCYKMNAFCEPPVHTLEKKTKKHAAIAFRSSGHMFSP